MNVKLFIFLFSLILLFSCKIDKNPILSSPQSKYFPLNVGNTWYYDHPSPQSDPWAMKTIKSNFIQKGLTYFSWTFGEGVDVIDNIRVDEDGNIWKLQDNIDYLWFDFSQDSGATYTYNYPESFGDKKYYYIVTVRKNITVETPAGTFDNCVELNFDIPQVRDEDRTYAFAPGVGPVRIVNNGWSLKNLTSAVINSVPIDE